MTPFGIRKKLKAILGFKPPPSAPPRPERPRYTVHFELPNGDTFEAEGKQGDSLVLASGRGPYPIATGCSDGTCGTCKIEILAGVENISQSDEYEERTKKENSVDQHLRLGCQAAILGSGISIKMINVLGEELVD